MHIRANTLDDLLQEVFSRLLRSRNRTISSKGSARELIATMLTIKSPRARFSRTERRGTLFSCLGETLWYLSGSDSFDVVAYYIPRYRRLAGFPEDAHTDDGAYGPRIFGEGANAQIHSIIKLLKRKSDTRQAVVQIFDANDLIRPNTNVPCTCTMQFFARGRMLHMLVHMRSNDAYVGLPHDVFAFTMIQELVARSISHEIGEYHHAVGSLHLYDDNEAQARQFLEEGWQDQVAMPPMPIGDPWCSVRWLLQVEQAVRHDTDIPKAPSNIDPYWVDLAQLLKIKALLAKSDLRQAVREKNAMSSHVYDAYVRGRERVVLKQRSSAQLLLPDITGPDGGRS